MIQFIFVFSVFFCLFVFFLLENKPLDCTTWGSLSAASLLGCSLRIQPSWGSDCALFRCCLPRAESSSSPGNYAWVHNCLTLTIYNLVLICIFSILFSIHFPRCWQGEFVKQWRASFVGNNFLHSQNLNVWIRADVVRIN